MKLFSLLLATLLISGCEKKEKDNTLLVGSLLVLNEQNKRVVDTTPRCRVSVTGTGSTNVISAPFYTATTTEQAFAVQGDNIALGVSFQYYAVMRVTAKVNGKLFFRGGFTFFTPKIFADSTSCDLNYSATSLSAGTLNLGSGTATLTFSTAGTYLVPIALTLNDSNSGFFVRYSD
jgi:hypothetical protein